MPLILATFGYENFNNTGSRVGVFIFPSRQFKGREVALDIGARAANPLQPVTRHARPALTPAGQGMDPRIVGQWESGTYDVPEGMILRLTATRTGQAGTRISSGSILIQVRSSGPMYRIAAILSAHPKATMVRAPLEGRFDVLTLAEAQRLGASIPPAAQAQLAPAAVQASFDILAIEPQRAAPVVEQVDTVTNGAGQVVEVTTKTRRRMIDV